MSDRYRLVALGNDQLVATLAELVRRENDAMSDLLAHLAELDGRHLHLDLGFTSLFAYCTQRHSVSASSLLAGEGRAAREQRSRYRERSGRSAARSATNHARSTLADERHEARAVPAVPVFEQRARIEPLSPDRDVCRPTQHVPFTFATKGAAHSTRGTDDVVDRDSFWK